LINSLFFKQQTIKTILNYFSTPLIFFKITGILQLMASNMPLGATSLNEEST